MSWWYRFRSLSYRPKGVGVPPPDPLWFSLLPSASARTASRRERTWSSICMVRFLSITQKGGLVRAGRRITHFPANLFVQSEKSFSPSSLGRNQRIQEFKEFKNDTPQRMVSSWIP